MSRPQHLRSLTSLRFFAALGVLLHHHGQSLLPYLPEFGDNLIAHGKSGVAFFFILSGFILTHTYGDAAGGGTLRLGEFWRSRFARIYPLYLVVLLATAPLALYSVRSMGMSYPPGFTVAAVVTKLTLLHSWYPPFLYDPPWVIPGWTLSVEAFFYALFPWLVPALSRLTNRRLVPAALVLLLLTWVPRVMVAGTTPGPAGETFAQMFPPLRLAEFALGIMLALMFRRGSISNGLMLSNLGMVVSLLSMGITRGSDLQPTGLLFTTGFALMIVGFAQAHGSSERGFGARPLVLLGESSFALYLVHHPLGVAMNGVLLRLGMPLHESPAAFAIYLVASVGLSILLYSHVEEPLRMRIRGQGRPRVDAI